MLRDTFWYMTYWLANLILMPVSLTDHSSVIPSLDRTPGELETTRPVSNPVPRTLQLLVVRTLAKLEPGRVHGVDVIQGVAELVDLGSRSSASWNEIEIYLFRNVAVQTKPLNGITLGHILVKGTLKFDHIKRLKTSTISLFFFSFLSPASIFFVLKFLKL